MQRPHRHSQPATSNQQLATRKVNRRTSARGHFGLEPLDPRILLTGTVFATILHDANGNGIKDPEEPQLQGWTVFVDYDRNGNLDAGEPSGVTNIDGEVFITGVLDNTWDIVQVLQPGWAPAPGFDVVDRQRVRDNQETEILFMNVPSANGGIDGTVWNDLNGDGTRDPGDPGLQGWTVYIDSNTNNTADPGEPLDITDAAGYFAFPNLATGQYRLRQIIPNGWDTTIGYDSNIQVDVTPAVTTTVDFGNFSNANLGTIAGTVFNDVNADGIRALSDSGLSGWTVFLDGNSSGTLDIGEPSALTDALGYYSFPSVVAGTYRVVEVLESGWNPSPGHTVAKNTTVIGDNTSIVDFPNYTVILGSIGGKVWNDINGDGLMGAEPGLSGWTVFIDGNSDGALNAGEASAISDSTGTYTLNGVPMGSQLVRTVPAIGWQATAPGTGMQLVNMLNGTAVTGINFGNQQRTDSSIAGVVFNDRNKNGTREAGEPGLSGITVYLDLNANGAMDTGEPNAVTSIDLFYTPAVDEAGTYEFTHLAGGDFQVRQIVPIELSATLAADRLNAITLLPGEARANVNFANRYRPVEIHGIKFHDLDSDHVFDAGEPGMGGVTIYIDLDRDDVHDAGEPTTTSGPDGSYEFTGLDPDSYVVREIEPEGYAVTYPTTTGGILWPTGVSNSAVGNVTPTSITTSLTEGQTYSQTVSITLPGTGALTNLVDVFLLFDDTGSFTANSPIVRAAFPQIISSLQAALPGTDLGFGVGRLEEYANFAAEYGTGRPFVLNQPIVAQGTAGFAAAIQAALDRMAPGYGGDQPETDIEALFQLVTGRGFDGNNNGSLLDSGAAGLVSTQLTPGSSGDVPPFSSFVAAGPVLPAAGSVGGGGFRAGALPIILLATDTGFAYQPRGETSITGLGGLTLPLSALTQTSRPTTPFNSGAGIQETVTALNALGALVIGLGTNPQATLAPRSSLEALAKLTGATNQTALTIANGTTDPIAPGDPFYFQIASGFGTSVANGVVSAIQNAATNVAVNITVRASDPRVHIVSLPGVVNGVGAGQTATFDVTFTGDGIPHRFDLQFVRQGTDVVLGSIPVVLGTPIPGDGYEFEDCHEGEIHSSVHFGSRALAAVGLTSSVTTLPTAVTATSFPVAWTSAGATGAVTYDIFVSDNGGPFTLWLNDTSGTSANFQGESFHTYGFYSVATDLSLTEAAPVIADATTLVAAVEGTAGDDAILLRLDPADPTVLQVYRTPTTTGAPALAAPLSSLPLLAIAGLDGADQIILDFSNGAPIPAGGISVDGGAATDTLKTVGGSLGGDVITISPTSIDLNGKVATYAATESIEVAPIEGSDLSLTGAAVVTLSNAPLLLSLSVYDTSRLVTAGPGALGLRTSSFTLAPGATLDLADKDLIVHSTAAGKDAQFAALEALVASARNALPLWGGAGITSSVAAADALGRTGLAVFLNDNGAGLPIRSTFDGVSVNADDVLIKFTWNGDANLDGVVDIDDYFAVDIGYALARAGYVHGDINYSGAIDAEDYFLLDLSYLTQAMPLATSVPLAGIWSAAPVAAGTGLFDVPILASGADLGSTDPLLLESTTGVLG